MQARLEDFDRFVAQRRAEAYPVRPFWSRGRRVAAVVALALGLVVGSVASARAAKPSSTQRAFAACKPQHVQHCRRALIAALDAAEWQRLERWHAEAITVQQITIDAIKWAAARYHVSEWSMRSVMNCESHLWPFATNGKYKGAGQLGGHHLDDPIFSVVPWQDAYAQASHMARYVKRYGFGEWQCKPGGGLRW